MAGKVYSAGTIFLQVVPVFKDTMNELRRESKTIAKALGDDMDKAGKEAGQRAGKSMGSELEKAAKEAGQRAGDAYGGDFEARLKRSLDKAQREIDLLNGNKLATFSDGFVKDLEKAKAKLKEMQNTELHVGFDSKKMLHDLQHTLGMVDRLLKTEKPEVEFDHNLLVVRKEIEAGIAQIDAVVKKKREIFIDTVVKTEPLERALGQFEAKARSSSKNAAKALGDNMTPAIEKVRKELASLGDADFGIDIHTDVARERIAALAREIKAVAQDESIDIVVRANAMTAYTELLAINSLGNQLDGKHWDVTVGLDAKEARTEMGAFESKVRETSRSAQRELGGTNASIIRIKDALASISNPDITPELHSAHAMAEIRGLAGELKAMASDVHLDAEVRLDAAAAYTKLIPLTKAFSAIDGKHLNVTVDLDEGAAVAKLGAFRVAMNRLKSGNDDGATSFRAFNLVVLAAVSLLPALIPIIAGVGGGLLALGPILGATGAGLGIMLAGFSGILPVVKAYSDVQKNAGNDALQAEKRIRSAARGVADAERSLAQARKTAAQSNADAARSVAQAQLQSSRSIKDALASERDAQRNLTQAQQDARKAQDNLREARKKAADELKASQDNRAQNALDIRQGVVDVFNATVANSAVQSDGAATNLDKETSSIALEQARLNLAKAREEQKRLAAEKAQQDKTGIDGTATVKSAQDQLSAALQRQADAQRAVGKAAEDVKRARIDGARSVADAVRNQQRTEESGAKSVADAQRNLTQAQEDYKTATEQTSASVRTLNDALTHIGPAGQRFAKFILGLKEQAYGLRDAIQEAMLPGVQAGLQTLINTYGPQFQSFAARMGGAIGKLFKQAGQGLGQEPWRAFFSTYAKISPKLMTEFAQTTGNWMSVFAKIFTIAAPYAERFSKALLDMSNHALRFTMSKEGTTMWTKFLDYAARVGPMIGDFLWNLVLATIAISKALAPWGETVLKALDGFVKYIAQMDPQTLSTIATSIIGLAIAFQVANGAMAGLAAAKNLLSNPLGLLIFVVIALAVAFYSLYQNSETFRNGVDKIGRALRDHKQLVEIVAGALGGLLLAYKAIVAYQAFVKTLQTSERAMSLLLNATKAYSALMGGAKFLGAMAKATGAILVQNAALLANPYVLIAVAIIALVGVLIYLFKHNKRVHDAVIGAWNAIKRGAIAIWKVILPILAAIGHAFMWLWSKAVKPAATFIIHLFTALGKAIWWVGKNIIWPIIDLIRHVIIGLWKFGFKVAIAGMKVMWTSLGTAIRWVWRNLLKPVFNAIGDVVGWLWRKVFRPIFGWIKDRWHDMALGMKIVWDKTLGPIFKRIGDVVLPKLKSAFKTAIDGIKALWNGLKQIIASPIRFVIEKVINGGLIAGFNWVARKVGSTPMTPIPLPDALKAPKGKQRGGTLRSASDYNVYPGYTPGRDIGFIGISGGEGILRPEATRALGHDWIAQTNAAAIQGGVEGVRKRLGQGGYAGGFARGGVVWPVPGHATGTYPGHNGVDINRGSGWQDYGDPIVAFRSGKITYAGWGRGYGHAIMEQGPGYPEVVYGHTSKVYVHAGQSVKAGQLIGRVGSTGNSSAPHLHFGLVHGGTTANALALLSGAMNLDLLQMGAGGTGIEPKPEPSWISKIIGKGKDWIGDHIAGPSKDFFKKFGDNPLTQTMLGVGKKLVGGVADKVEHMASSFRDKLASVASSVTGAIGGVLSHITGGDGVHKDVRAVAKAYGWDKGKQWEAIDYIVSHESGWNPNAANGHSSARGLFQKMTSIHGPIEKTATGQAKWGLDYIAHRYGTPVAAENYWKSHGNYADGGVVPEAPVSGGVADNGTMMYDSGGYLPPGLTTVLNLTGKPEPVFTADQFAGMRAGTTGEGFTYAPTFNKSDLTAADVADDLEFTYRRLGRDSARYGRRG